MATVPTAVFVVDRDGEVDVYKSLEDAGGFMDADDVRDGEFIGVYGVDGRVVAVATEGEKVVLRWTDFWNLGELRGRLRAYRDSGEDLVSDPDDTVAVANEMFRRTWEARIPMKPRWLDRRLFGTEPTVVQLPPRP